MIDADSILYAIALQAEAKMIGKNGEPDQYFIVKSIEECYLEVVRRLETLVQEVRAEDALICLTPAGKCFRYNLLASYKANRATYRRPEILRPLQALVAERKPFRTFAVWGLEADDLCGIASTSFQKANLREPVIVSIDKDMQQIPGLSYSWMAAARTGTIGELMETTEAEGDRMHFYQTLVGDVVDNYTGCPGIGPVKANKILDGCIESQGDLDWRWIVAAFQKKGLSESYVLTQARVARILRDEDWDPKRKEVKLWTPPPREFSKSSPAVKPAPIASANKKTSGTSKGKAPAVIPTSLILDERKGVTLH